MKVKQFIETFKNSKNARLSILSLMLLALIPQQVFAQSGENIVILWDVTGSLLPQIKGEKDLNGKVLPTLPTGNGMWKPLKEAIIDCINYVDSDPGNKITVITFNDNIRDTFTENATEGGKQTLIDIVTNYEYKSHKHTNIVTPINKFYSLLDPQKINYMFLFTDGENDDPVTRPKFITTLNSWKTKTAGKDAFGFYVLVHPAADKTDVRKAVKSQENFWIVPDAKVHVKISSFPSTIKYNIRDQKGEKTIKLIGNSSAAKGNVKLVANDSFYDVICKASPINNGKLDIEIKKKAGVTAPVNHLVMLTPVTTGTDPYTFVGPKSINLEVSNLPERSLSLTFDEGGLDEASYHGSFLWTKEVSKPAELSVNVDFNDQSKADGSKAVMKVYLVDKKTEEKLSFASQKLTLSINGENREEITLTPDITNVILSISGDDTTNDDTYYGRIELVPTKLENVSINGVDGIYKWKLKFSKNWNPLAKALFWILVIVVSALLVWFVVLQRIVYPRFKRITRLLVWGGNTVTLKFKNCRKVILTATPQKQSMLNRLFTGKIRYVNVPNIKGQIELYPVKNGRLIGFRSQNRNYTCSQTPIGMGPATITDINNNNNKYQI